MIVRLIYVATVANMTYEQLDQFVASVQADTRNLGISSVSVTNNHYYVHYMEGNREIVNKRYNELVCMQEHTQCTLLRSVEINNREFPDFLSAYDRLSVPAKEELVRLGPVDPVSITSATAMLLIRRAAAHHRYDEPTLFLQS